MIRSIAAACVAFSLLLPSAGWPTAASRRRLNASTSPRRTRRHSRPGRRPTRSLPAASPATRRPIARRCTHRQQSCSAAPIAMVAMRASTRRRAPPEASIIVQRSTARMCCHAIHRAGSRARILSAAIRGCCRNRPSTCASSIRATCASREKRAVPAKFTVTRPLKRLMATRDVLGALLHNGVLPYKNSSWRGLQPRGRKHHVGMDP